MKPLPQWFVSTQTIDERFDSKYVKLDNGCWQWISGKNWRGYSKFKLFRNTNITAHRWAYERINGKIPPGMTIDHLCRNRACVNVAHMEVVTQKVNLLRGDSPSSLNARKTHCKRGHPFNETNTIRRGLHRACRTCRNLYKKGVSK